MGQDDGAPPPGKVRVTPQQLIQMGQAQGHALGLQEGLGFILTGETDREVPDEHRRILADAFMGAINGEVLDKLPCAHCEQLRPAHALAEDGWRYCPVEPADGEERTKFTPKPLVEAEEPSRLVGADGRSPLGADPKIVVPGRG